jgi:hypothetical protein
MKINQELINGLNNGTTLLKFLLCTKTKIGFHMKTRKASPSRYAINIKNGIKLTELRQVNHKDISFMFM